MSDTKMRRGPYVVTYKFIDYDAEIKEETFNTWRETCDFMRQLLIDGYEVQGVAFG